MLSSCPKHGYYKWYAQLLFCKTHIVLHRQVVSYLVSMTQVADVWRLAMQADSPELHALHRLCEEGRLDHWRDRAASEIASEAELRRELREAEDFSKREEPARRKQQ